MAPTTDTLTRSRTFARPPVEGHREELRVYACAYSAGWDCAAAIGRDVLASLRVEVGVLRAEIARRDAEDHADAAALAVVLAQRPARPHLDVQRDRGARPAEVARAQEHSDRVWAPLASTSTVAVAA